MRRRLEMDIATCEDCPYLRYNSYYHSMQEDSGYDCENLNAKHTGIVNFNEIPDWCPLPKEVLA